MSKKKDHKSEELSEQERINRRVDAMLNPKLPDPPDAKQGGVPPLDIFKDAPAAKTAPEVSGKLLDQVDDKVKSNDEPRQSQPTVRHKPPKPQPQDAAKDPVSQKDPLADTETDKAVVDIAAKEGDTLLALQDAIGRKASHLAGDLAEEDRRTARQHRWLWFIFLVVFVIVVLLALPLTPYTCRWPVGVRLRVTTDILPSVCK